MSKFDIDIRSRRMARLVDRSTAGKGQNQRSRSMMANLPSADASWRADCASPSCSALNRRRDEIEALQRAQAALLSATKAEREQLDKQRRLILHMQLLGQEADHRLLNGLQLVASLLAMQARRCDSPQAAVELNVAARRVATIGNLHRRLHGADSMEVVELTAYLESVCSEIVEMVAIEGRDGSIAFSGVTLRTLRIVAIPLGFICAELLTNAAKYASGDIAVRLEDIGGGRCALSVIDQGPGLPDDFNPEAAKGLGMKIIASLVKDIAGELVVSSGDSGRGAKFSVLFAAIGR
jgi:two-component sensor histidine kinase